MLCLMLCGDRPQVTGCLFIVEAEISIDRPMPILQASLAFPGHCLVSEYEATLHKDVWTSLPHNIHATVSFAQCIHSVSTIDTCLTAWSCQWECDLHQ